MPISAAKLRYRRSRKGLLTRLYNDQKSRCKRDDRAPPDYTLQEFQDMFYTDKDFNEIYRVWVILGYITTARPSIDRIDCFKSYTFDNIQVLPWWENHKKAVADKKRHKERKV